MNANPHCQSVVGLVAHISREMRREGRVGGRMEEVEGSERGKEGEWEGG